MTKKPEPNGVGYLPQDAQNAIDLLRAMKVIPEGYDLGTASDVLVNLAFNHKPVALPEPEEPAEE